MHDEKVRKETTSAMKMTFVFPLRGPSAHPVPDKENGFSPLGQREAASSI